MATLQTAPRLGIQAPSFRLPATDGKTYSLKDVSERNGAVVAFICNHCPYVKAVAERIVADAKTLMADGFGFVAINANDPVEYPEDSPANMKLFAARYGFPFPYLFDATQSVAKAYDAACTPDLYLFDGQRKLVYRGQFDDSRPGRGTPTGKDLRDACDALLNGKALPSEQKPSLGCNIKWKS